MVLICNVISEDHVIKRSCESMAKDPLMFYRHPAMFSGHRHYDSGDMNIPANTVILPQMWDIRDGICPPISAIIIFSRAHGMS